MLTGIARGLNSWRGDWQARGNSEGASKKNLVVFLFGDVLGLSFFLKMCNVFVTTISYATWLRLVNSFFHNYINVLQVKFT